MLFVKSFADTFFTSSKGPAAGSVANSFPPRFTSLSVPPFAIVTALPAPMLPAAAAVPTCSTPWNTVVAPL